MTEDNKRFVIYWSTNRQYYFVLKASNGQVLMTSETYTTKQSAERGIAAVKSIAATAPVIDMTTP